MAKKRLIDADACGRHIVSRMGFGYACVEVVLYCMEEYTAQNKVNAVEITDNELMRAVDLLIIQYERSKRSDYVRNPIAHAFYHTWKKLDESGYGGRKK